MTSWLQILALSLARACWWLGEALCDLAEDDWRGRK